MLLADMGAEVIMIERPQGGDPSRRFSGLFASFNRNKQSVTLNLKTDAGREQFLKLVDTADVVIEGFRPGVMDRLGIGAETLRSRKPSLIFASISSFGQTGPLAQIAGHDLSIQGAVGLLRSTPTQERREDVPMLPLADISSAMFAALGIVTSLYARTKTNAGQVLDISMMDSLVSWMTPFLVPPMNNLPTRELPPLDPGYGIFGTRDGKQMTLSIAGEDKMWSELCHLLNLNALAALNESERSARVEEIDPLLRAAIREWNYQDLYNKLEQQGVAFGPLIPIDEVMSNPQIKSRGMNQTLGSHSFVAQPIQFNGDKFPIQRGVPGLGEQTQNFVEK
jgi:crotonobetainyl-CoA:carnitine CoA-transferase CaiB-like acyl-CoA transferase